MRGLQIVRASAGSGKTFLLAQEYLQIALPNIENVSQIIALTFTKAATAEMKKRIIQYCYELTKLEIDENNIYRHANNKFAALANTISTNLKIVYPDETFNLASQAKMLLHKLLYDYSNFQIQTLDSFFKKILQNFSRELYQNEIFDIELDTKKPLSFSIEKMIQKVGLDQSLTQWLETFILNKIDKGYSWDIRRDIRKLGNEIFTEKFNNFNFEHIDGETLRNNIEILGEIINEKCNQILEKLSRLGNDGMNIMLSYGLTAEDFKGSSRSEAKKFELLADVSANIDKLPNVCEKITPFSIDNWINKTAKPNIKDKLNACLISGGLADLYTNLYQYIKENVPIFFLYKFIQKNFESLGVISELLSGLKEFREKNDVLLGYDISKLIFQLTGEEENSLFLYEKIGNRLNYLLLDEFQDTSELQWKNLKFLIENALASGGYNLIVGDIKQSIYRWRSGDWELLDNRVKKDLLHILNEHDIHEKILDTNYRSNKNIVLINNILFGNLPAILPEIEYINREKIFRIFEDCHQNALTNVSDGYVSIEMVFPEDISNTNFKIPQEIVDQHHNKPEIITALLKLATCIEKLLTTGYKKKDILILTRTNTESKTIADFLMAQTIENTAQTQFPVISNETLELGSSQVIRLLTRAMQYLADYSDSYVCSLLLYDYLNYYAPEKPATEPENKVDFDWYPLFFSGKDEKSAKEAKLLRESYLPDELVNQREKLIHLTLYELAESLIRIFDLRKNNEAAILGWLQAIAEYYQNKESDKSISGWLNYWREKNNGKEIPLLTAIREDAIRLMTIHKSKGLEEKIVIIPFANWAIDLSSTSYFHEKILWVSTEKTSDLIPAIPLQINKKNFLNAGLQSDYTLENTLTVIDNLNLLYVAMTRPIEQLYIFVPQPEKAAKQAKNTMVKLFTGFFDYIKNSSHPQMNLSQDDKLLTVGKANIISQDNIDKEESSAQIVLDSIISEDWRKHISFSVVMSNSYGNIKTQIADGIYTHVIKIINLIKNPLDWKRKLKQMKETNLYDHQVLTLLNDYFLHLFNHPIGKNWFNDTYQTIFNLQFITANGSIITIPRVLRNTNETIYVFYHPDAELKTEIKQHYTHKCYQLSFDLNNEIISIIN